MSRGPSRATRLARRRDQLKDRPRSVADVAATEGMTRRTIERDIASLDDEDEDWARTQAWPCPRTPTSLR